MPLVYLDTHSGIAGDMLLAALVDAGANRDYLNHQVHSLPGLQQVELVFSETERHCFRALQLDIRHAPEHAHRGLRDIEAMINASQLSDRERDLALRIFRRLGSAEAKVHGTTLDKVHFHEVGAIDSIVDIVGIAICLCDLQIRRIVASPTPTGSGTVQIAHGLVSVPAPATAELLRGIPIRSSRIDAELTTPTGAAVLATLADGFGVLPDMQISRIGYGAGHMHLKEQANVLRVLVGTALRDESDEVAILETNIDDSTAEQIGFTLEQLWKLHPLDVFTTAIGMKKNRPGTLISVICHPEQRGLFEDCLFQHTGSLGIRRTHMARRKLRREVRQVETAYGQARVKLAWLQDSEGLTDSTRDAYSADCASFRVSPEYEDCRRLATENNQTLEAVFAMVRDAALQQLQLTHQRSILPKHDRGHDYDHHDHHDHDHDHSHDHDHHHHDDQDHHDHHAH